MEIFITGAVLRSRYFLTLTYKQKVGEIFNEVKFKSDAIVHEDLQRAFKQLVPHLALICEDVPDGPDMGIAMEGAADLNQENATAKLLAAFSVQSFAIVDGEGEKEGVVISGKKKLGSKKSLALTAPAMRWLETYPYMDDLKAAVETLKEETLAYLNGKVGAPRLPLEEGQEDGQELFEEEND